MAVALADRVIESQQGRVRTRVMVRGSGDPVVFLHGAGGLMWDPFLDDLAGRFTVYAPEHPGTGESSGVDQFDGLWDLVLHYYDLFDALGLRAPAVVGHSFGGMVAAELAATNPERVSRLVLIAPIGLWRDDHPVADWVALPQEELAARVFADPAGPIAQAALALPEDPDEKANAMLRMVNAFASTSHFVWPIPDKGLKKRIHRISQPTLIVWGNLDGLAPPIYAQEFARRIPQARVEMVDGAAHVPQLEQRERISRVINDFLAGD